VAKTIAKVTEPTGEQIKLIADIHEQAGQHVSALQALMGKVAHLQAAGLSVPGDHFGEALDGLRGTMNDLRILRATGGREDLATWWFRRVHLGLPLGQILDDPWEPQERKHILAIEESFEAKNPKLMTALDRVAGRSYIHDEAEFVQRTGMTRAEVWDAAEAALNELIESGWRP
jgi:hypothetical protein